MARTQGPARARPAEPGPDASGACRPRSAATLALAGVAAVVVTAVFVALGIWQVERRAWKLDLIDRVEARIHAEPAAAPGPPAWPGVNAADDEYRRVSVQGAYDHGRETLVQAVTDLGAGFWVVTPFRADGGFTILVNRGFVPAARRDRDTRGAGLGADRAVVTGLLRMSEPGGGFLRANDPAGGRWYSRDVAAMAAARGLVGVAPYFIDADGTSNPGGLPVGGLTVVRFHNAHLVYALTWFGLALLTLAGTLYAAREEVRLRVGPRVIPGERGAAVAREGDPSGPAALDPLPSPSGVARRG